VDVSGPRRQPCASLGDDPAPTARDMFGVWILGHKPGQAHVSVTVTIVTYLGTVTLHDSLPITVVPVLTLVSPTVSNAGRGWGQGGG
jgi:hypothetical protein